MDQFPTILIVYASQTGQAKAIAESLNDLAQVNGFEPKLYCISKHGKEFNFNELNDPLVFVCSTTGDGEVPETAYKTWNKLKRLDTENDKDYLKNLNYALLGLGDTNYTQFCNGPKSFHNKFQELGAKCFFGPFWADDGTGLEQEVEPFKENLWDALDDFFNNQKIHKDENKLVNELTLKAEKLSLNELTIPELTQNNFTIDEEIGQQIVEESEFDRIGLFFSLYPSSSSGIFRSSITQNCLLTKPGFHKEKFGIKFVVNEEFKDKSTKLTSEISFDYEPGHSIDVICQNDQNEVKRLLNRLNVNDHNKRLCIKSVDSSKKLGASHVKLTEANRISFLHFFTYCVDIRNACLKKSLLRTLAEYCSDKEDETRLLELCSKEGNEQYMKMIKEDHLSLLDVLNVFKSCKPSISHLIQMLPALSTRSYTLCSFNEKEKSSNELEVVFNIVKFNQERNRTYERNGIATGYLTGLKLGDDLYFMKRRFQNFTFPNECLSKPIIMIGPGTGIAPFMSFLRSQHAQAEKSLAQNNLNLYLFYGCRDPIQDFLFKDELTKKLVYLLKKFSVSYSRTDENCIEQYDSINKEFHVTNSKYVQDSIRFYSKDIIEQVYDQDGYIYVCGDAQNMSKDVLNCFIECLSAEKNFSVEESNKYFSEMIKSKRYKQDIWS